MFEKLWKEMKEEPAILGIIMIVFGVLMILTLVGALIAMYGNYLWGILYASVVLIITGFFIVFNI